MSKSGGRETVGEVTRRDGMTAGGLALRDLKWRLMKEEQEEQEKGAKEGLKESPPPKP